MNLDNIPNWFLINNLSDNQRSLYKMSEKEIIKETEKAVLIKVYTEYGNYTFWCPKSVVLGSYAIKKVDNIPDDEVVINGRKFVKAILIANRDKIAKDGLSLRIMNLTSEEFLALQF